MAGRRFACFEIDDGEIFSAIEILPNVVRGEASVFCKLWMDVCGTDDDIWEIFKVHQGDWPSLEDAKNFDAIIVPGARHSAYDVSIPWIPKFTQILKKYAENGVKLVGGCFGCQILAIALGGRVGKNPSESFALKVETIELLPPLLDKLHADGIETPTSNSFNALESHGDQVLELPPEAVLLARSATAPNEIWTHGGNVLGLQSHPEIVANSTVKQLVSAVIAAGVHKEEESDRLYQELTTPSNNHAELGAFIRNFVHSGPRRGEATSDPKAEQGNELPETAPPSRTQKVKDEFNRLYASTVDMIDAIPLSTGMSLSAFKKGMGFGQGQQSGGTPSVSEEEYVSPGVQQVRGALDKSAKSFSEKVADLMRLELERGFLQYDRLEVANRLAGAEFQKLAEAVKEVGQGREGVEAEHERIGNEVHQVLDELSDIVSQIETAVAKLVEDTNNLEKKK
ncbi:hypothetical protein BSKO_09503 [Bryopsis sp. KO-2023]|nr:hypothetical protein BSKO_09503 [Bryopsis sp. KO-2023]